MDKVNSCEVHMECGKFVETDEVIVLKKCVRNNDFCLKALLVRGGAISPCCVRHVNERAIKAETIQNFGNAICQVVEGYQPKFQSGTTG